MAFDFKKEYKKFYMPKNIPEIVTVPKANFIAVRGKVILMTWVALINRRLGYFMQ